MIKKVERERNEVRDKDLLSQIALEVEQEKAEDKIKKEGAEVARDYTVVED
jgi:trimethylamine:corrinoid methyltransferase-like protein